MREQIRRQRRSNRGDAFVNAITVIAICANVFAFSLIRYHMQYPVETWHNVYIWYEKRGEPETWGVWTKEIGWTEINCCPDYPCSPHVEVGWIADTVAFEQRGPCKSIRAQGLGFYYRQNNENGRAIQ
jgi:hypothetical protein